MKKLITPGLLLALFAICTVPHKRKMCEGFLPKNNLRIPVGDVRAMGIDEATFNAVMDKAEKVYGPIVAAHGGKLVVNRLWTDETVNASAEQQGSNWIINMYGGLARHKDINYAGMMLVACHELGHHLGGFPLYNGGDWAANEGEADYFADLKCLRLTLGDQAPADTDPTPKSGCAAAYPAGADRNHCESGAMAGVSVSSLLAELGGSPTPSFTTPDTSVVDATNDAHPAAQCRLDTYFAGAECSKPVGNGGDMSRADAFSGCTKKEGFSVGYRPRCWYAPAAGAESATPAIVSRIPSSDIKTVQARLESLRTALSGNDL